MTTKGAPIDARLSVCSQTLALADDAGVTDLDVSLEGVLAQWSVGWLRPRQVAQLVLPASLGCDQGAIVRRRVSNRIGC
jgi:hypothetical protein